VVDEYHALAGLVTIEDVLEEIVGEIVDEHDADEEEPIAKIDDATYVALAATHVEDVNERLGLGLPEDDEYDTLGGFLFQQLGRVPRKGDRVTLARAHLVVESATRRRVETVRVELMQTAGGEPAEA